jgi:patatin-like phospholipase/acyl hydrolase
MKYLLSIDGGGIRGLVPLYFLLHLEKDLIKKTGKGIFDTFDMYAGTSVGAIIIGSIVYTEFKSIQDLIDTMYTKENFKKLFTKYPNIMRTCMMRPKYSGRFKTKLLRQYLKDTTIVNTEKKVIIPVYSVLEQKTKFYKSYYVSDKDKYNKDNSQLLLSSIIDASSAAPVYFPSTEYYSDHEEDDTIQSPVKSCIQ